MSDTDKTPFNTDIISQVFEFNREVVGIDRRTIQALYDHEKEHLLECLNEEVQEFEEAQDPTGQIDALCDLMYFAIGGFVKLGITERQAIRCFNEVHRANMTKKPGQVAKRAFDGVGDAQKPEGWVAPEIRILNILSNEAY